MKILVIYDTLYGNTEKMARAIAGAVSPPDTVRILRASEARPADLEGVEVFFVGSPTQGGRATQAVQDFLDKLPAGALKNIRAAAFDTRMKGRFAKIFGYAATRIEKALKEKGGTLAPAGLFFVKGKEGPLVDREEERAAAWARGVVEGKG